MPTAASPTSCSTTTSRAEREARFSSARSTDKGASWSAPTKVAAYQNPVCLFLPYCFTISGGPFRGPGTYAAPAFNPMNNRLYVAYADMVDGRGQIFLTSASVDNLASWAAPAIVVQVPSGDRFAAELGVAPAGRIDVASTIETTRETGSSILHSQRQRTLARHGALLASADPVSTHRSTACPPIRRCVLSSVTTTESSRRHRSPR